MRRLAKPTNIEPIGVDLSDQDVRELLQCCYNPPPASGSAYKTINPATVEDQFALLAMFDKFDFPEGQAYVLDYMEARFSKDTWKYFRLASDRDSETLALMVLDHKSVRVHSYFHITGLEEIRYEWRLPLMIVIASTRNDYHRSRVSEDSEMFFQHLADAKSRLGLATKADPAKVPSD
jgi:hypothetical protein